MRHLPFVVLSVGLLAVGCSDSQSTQNATAARGPSAISSDNGHVYFDPAVADSADKFMRAILSGDSAGAARLLTAKAAQRYAMDPSVLTPMGMQVERLEVGEVRMLDIDQAAAQCLVTVPGTSEPQELCCLLKRGSAGWRVCGMACETADQDTTVISFEDAPEPSDGQFVEGENQSPSVPKTAVSPQSGGLR